LERYGEGLSLPAGVTRPVEVVPAELRHRLWLQSAFDHLSGLGQEPELTLHDEEQRWRIGGFLAPLRKWKDNVGVLRLTLDRRLGVLVLPEGDVPLFVEMVQERLGLASGNEPLAGRL